MSEKDEQMKYDLNKMKEIRKKLEEFINSNSIDSYLNVPDFILTEFLLQFLMRLKFLTEDRDKWFGFEHFLKETKTEL